MNNNFVFRFAVAALLLAALAFVPATSRAAEPGRIASALQPFVDHHTLAGAVTLVANKDKFLDVATVGFADITAKKPMRADALFWIASMSKPITAAALMILVDEGKVNVNDPVEKYLPEFKDQMVVAEQDKDHVVLRRPKHPITVKNVLSHTSGLPFKSGIEQPTLDLFPLRARVLSYAMSPLQFEPDSKYQYSNAGINTAGRIIEVVSGMPYEKFLDERLFKPLGMRDTTFWPTSSQIRRIAKSYRPNKEKTGLEETIVAQLQYPLNDPVRQPMPAGGLFSTAQDVGRFGQMVLGGGVFNEKRILSEEAVKQMTSVQTGDLPQGYGFGFSVEKKPDGTFGHGGAYATQLRIDPHQQLVMVLMVQHTGGFPNGDEGKKINPTFFSAAASMLGK